VTEPNSANTDNLDSFLGDLQRELSVTPSPDFAARVRAQVERETSRGWSPARWFFGAFALASAAVVVMMLIWNRPAPVQPAGPAVASHQPTTPALPSTPPAVAQAPISPTPAAPRPARHAARAKASLHATSQGPVTAGLVNGDPMTVDPTTAEPSIRTFEVLVPPDQEIALRRLLRSMRAGGAGAPPPGSSFSASEPLPIPSLVIIAPIRIEAVPGSVTGGGRR